MSKKKYEYLRISIHIEANEYSNFFDFFRKRSKTYSEELYKIFDKHYNELKSCELYQSKSINKPKFNETINIVYIEEYKHIYNLIKKWKNNTIFKLLIKQAILENEINLASLARFNLKKSSKSQIIKVNNFIPTYPIDLMQKHAPLLTAFQGKLSPQLIFDSQNSINLLFKAVNDELIPYIDKKNLSLEHVKFNWALIPPEEYPQQLKEISRIRDIKEIWERCLKEHQVLQTILKEQNKEIEVLLGIKNE